MTDKLIIQGNIATLRDAVPIRFVYHKSVDSPEDHVLHINTYLEIYVFVQGNHQYIVENQIYGLQRGDIILINPREVHKPLPLETCLYERFYLLVDERCLDGLALNPLADLLSPSHHTGNLISPAPEAREQILSLLYKISESFSDGRHCPTQTLGLFLQLLDLLVQQRSQVRSVPGGMAQVPELLKSILSYVAENAASIQTTTQIADALGISSPYLSSYFRKCIGTPLKIYIQAKKVALAKDLLDKGANVTEACFDSGFNDCSYFIRIFKSYVGVTPFNYRKMLNH